jgi:predicted regulator of Ras-like GTPase activity (Roadblock/LC7/MglB family)
LIKPVLEEFTSIDGVTAAALVGRDGFVIEIAHNHPPDTDALGALSSGLLRFFEQIGESLGRGLPMHLAMEFDGGAILLAPITQEEFLVILTETPAIMGKLNYLAKTKSARIVAAM